jgi:hypothetical protein
VSCSGTATAQAVASWWGCVPYRASAGGEVEVRADEESRDGNRFDLLGSQAATSRLVLLASRAELQFLLVMLTSRAELAR